ncbi:hypothetical protein [Rhodopirellula islandica]|nr:hypothetical protein [Rhodopirellula islandica]
MTNFEPSPNVQRLNMELDGSPGQDKKPSSINRIAAYERQHLPTGRRVVDTEAVDHCFGSDVDYLVDLDDCSSE